MDDRGASVALVFAGGDPPDPWLADAVPAEVGAVIAADSGVHHALAWGRAVDVVVGDLDSADPAAIDAAVAGGAEIERHPTDKDATDLELALVAARDRGATSIVVVGGGGGRLDHLLGNLLLLASPEFADVEIAAHLHGARVTAVHRRAELRGRPGDACSLFAVGGPARGVSTEALRYPLRGEVLHPGSTRGISNELLESVAVVTIDEGALLAIQSETGAL